MSTLSPASRVGGIRVALGIVGGLAVLFGVLILVWPGRVALAVALFLGIYAVAAGLVYVGLGIFARGTDGRSRAGHVVVGVLYVAAGVVIVVDLASATAFLATLIGVVVGIVWIVEGVVALSTLGDASSRGWTVLFAIVSILAGIALLFTPLWGAAVLWWFVGVSAVVLGALQIARALRWDRD